MVRRLRSARLCTWPPLPPWGPHISPPRPSWSSPPNVTQKIGLLAVGAILVAAATVAGGTDEDVAAVTAPTPTASATAFASPSVAPTISPAADPTSTPDPLAGTVIEVVDGDTIRVELPRGIETVRIIGIDTPEVVHPTEPEACFGAEATAFAKDTLEGETVTLEPDPTQDERDRYDRLLAHVLVSNTLYATEAIAAGYGIHYVNEQPSVHADELDAAAVTAR